MIDYVNAHLAAHPGPVRPRLYCADGYSLSVQASAGHYCRPRTDDATEYSMVEVGFPVTADGKTSRPTALGKPDGGVYAWVPVRDVNVLIKRHGGLGGASSKQAGGR